MSEIVKVEMGRFDYYVGSTFKFLPPDPDGVRRRPTVLVRLTDSEGMTGWGQAIPSRHWSDESVETVMATLRASLGAALLGLDPERVGAVHERMATTVPNALSTGQPFCKAAVDMACYDLAARRRNRSVSRVLGAKDHRSLTLSWTVSAFSLEGAEAQLEEGRAQGYENYNLKLGPPQSPAFDIELVELVRSYSRGYLWCDANTSYSPEQALELAPKLADAGVDVLESPLPPLSVSGYKALKAQGALPVVMDEGIVAPEVAAVFIELGMLDGIVLKPARNAGLWPSVQLVNLLRERGLLLLGSGLTEHDLALASSLHLFNWAGVTGPCALNGPQFLTNSLAVHPLRVQHGEIKVPEAPGLGLNVTPALASTLSVVAVSSQEGCL